MAIRKGFHTITPYLTTHDLDGLLGFIHAAFDATETFRDSGSAGGLHVELRIGDSMLMVGGLTKPDMPVYTALLYLYVDDPDAWYARAVEAGATSLMPPADTPDGERRAATLDPFGNQWAFGRPRTAG